jgi:hypothetical protein
MGITYLPKSFRRTRVRHRNPARPSAKDSKRICSAKRSRSNPLMVPCVCATGAGLEKTAWRCLRLVLLGLYPPGSLTRATSFFTTSVAAIRPGCALSTKNDCNLHAARSAGRNPLLGFGTLCLFRISDFEFGCGRRPRCALGGSSCVQQPRAGSRWGSAKTFDFF